MLVGILTYLQENITLSKLGFLITIGRGIAQLTEIK